MNWNLNWNSGLIQLTAIASSNGANITGYVAYKLPIQAHYYALENVKKTKSA